MSLDYEDTILAVEEGVRRGLKPIGDDAAPGPICPIQPIVGVDASGRTVQAIGVVWHEELLQFACIVSDPSDDSSYPIFADAIYPTGTEPQDLPEPPSTDATGRNKLPAAFRKPLKWPAFDSHFSSPREDV